MLKKERKKGAVFGLFWEDISWMSGLRLSSVVWNGRRIKKIEGDAIDLTKEEDEGST